MSEQHTDDSRNGTRVALIVCCVLAVLLAGMLVGAFGTGGLAGSPIDSVLPGEQVYDEYINDPAEDGVEGFGERRGGLGALNPGNETGVGNELGFDPETFGVNDTEVHFVVESSRSTYWRTGSYDTYTGAGWERNGDTEPYEEPIEHDGIEGQQISYEMTLNRSATSLPTAWQPTSVSGLDDLRVTEDRAVLPGETLEPGTTFSGVSAAPEDDTDILRAAGTSYPEDIEQQYTQLPTDTPSRVGEFTSDLTADADNRFEVAQEIQDWLRTEKGYSLNASTDSPHVADTFIFEMEDGYCEFFATAMTTMLRTQDIPARYVVGYSAGQSVGDGVYEVRGMNAHAWVEVYFPEVGWVTFDPTPGDERLATEQAVLEDAEPDREFEFGEDGSPGETFEPGDIQTPDPGQPPGDIAPPQNDTDTNGETGFDISLNRTAIPGQPVEVTVTYDDEPAPGMVVMFNGEEVGITDENGAVTGTVPFEEELRIAIEWSDDAPVEIEPHDGRTGVLDERTDESGTTTSMTGEMRTPTNWTMAPTGGATAPVAGGATAAVLGSGGFTTATESVATSSSTDSPVSTELASATEEGPEEEVVYEIETDAMVTVSGDVLPGNQVTVTALVGGSPIEGADVRIDGESHGQTDEDGRATVTLPGSSGEQTIAVERGAVSGEETVVIPELEVTAEADAPIALPFTSATVEAAYGNTSAVDAPVELAGEQVATTGSDGTATVQLPLSSSATLTVTDSGVSDSATVDNLFRNLLFVLLVAGVAAGGLVSIAVRQGPTVRGGLTRLVHAVRGLATDVRWVLITAATRSDVLVDLAFGRLKTTVEYVKALLTGKMGPSELRTAFLAWLTTRRGETRPDESTAHEAGDWEGSEAYVTVRTAWGRFLDNVSITDETTRTPGELATHAIERDGLPPEAVTTLRDTFREVEYGGRSASERLERVQRAIDDIDPAVEDVDEAHTGGAD